MQLALNISATAQRLLEQGRIDFDLFKYPAWPDLLRQASKRRPGYVHFPLNVGSGNSVIDTELNRPPDWRQIQDLLEQTHTPHVNLHLAPRAANCPQLDASSLDPANIATVTDNLVHGVSAVVQRFTSERVIVEGVYDHQGYYLRPALLPQVIARVVEETGCGFLLDVSHSRLAARTLGMDPYAYLSQLPTSAIREIHITGIQCFDHQWIERVQQTGADLSKLARFANALMDHLPMTEEDWTFCAWALDQVHQGKWREPWVVTFEYGGIGSWWGAITDEQVLLDQVPRLRQLVRSSQPDPVP